MTPLRLLQVELPGDDALVLEALSGAGFDVYARRVDSADGLRRELHHSKWDLVIADYAPMAGLTGAQALAIVREEDPHLPFIFVSRIAGEDRAVDAIRSGAHDYILKNDLLRLGAVVDRELREATARRERHLASQRVAYLAYHDSLTDLPNRTLFLDRLDQAILRSQRDGKGLAVLLVDLDGFKAVNDVLGHHTGDVVLQEVAGRLRGALRASDTVARLGGDEFAVLLPATDLNRGELAARKVLHDLNEPIIADGRSLMVSASIGIAGVPWLAATGDEALRKADAAMYVAKNDKVGYMVYNASHDRRMSSRISLASAMRQGLDQRQFVIDYQPIVQIPTGSIQAIEALVRWNHPEMGRLLPDDFIRVAEHTGLIEPLTTLVLESALAEWPRSSRPDDCALSINISPRSLKHKSFPGRIRDLLQASRLPASSLMLEVTENLLMLDPTGSVRCLEELHEMGVRLVIDDFGKGYSSLSYLRRLPVDEIKIDSSFIIGLAEGEDDRLVRCMIELAHSLGMSVVAEGVESDIVLQQLDALNCDSAQGYSIVRPAPAAAISDWINRREAWAV